MGKIKTVTVESYRRVIIYIPEGELQNNVNAAREFALEQAAQLRECAGSSLRIVETVASTKTS